MKNKILIILIVFACVLLVATYGVYSYRSSIAESQKINKEYEQYQDVQMLGSELISLINKTVDVDTKLGIEKDQNGMFIDNGENTIKIYVNFIYEDDYKTLEMEKIYETGAENFMKIYSTASFKCTEFTRHDKTNNVKSLTFTETND